MKKPSRVPLEGFICIKTNRTVKQYFTVRLVIEAGTPMFSLYFHVKH